MVGSLPLFSEGELGELGEPLLGLPGEEPSRCPVQKKVH